MLVDTLTNLHNYEYTFDSNPDAFVGVDDLSMYIYGNSDSIDAIEIDEFYDAFYDRMCFERDAGDLNDFLEFHMLTTPFITKIIERKFQNDCIYQEKLKEWIDTLETIASPEYNSVYQILANLNASYVICQKKHGTNEEFIAALESSIYGTEIKAYFESYFKALSSLNTMNSVIVNDEMTYCTPNTLTALEIFRQYNDTERFNRLMLSLEKSIPIIDKVQISSWKLQARCEIQKCKFMNLRNSFRYSSDFDSYLDGSKDKYISRIESLIKNKPANTDWNEISFDIQILMEIIWQTENWTFGLNIIEKLLLEFQKNNYNDELMNNEINILLLCKNYFGFKSDKNPLIIENVAIKIHPQYQFEDIVTFYSALQLLIDDDVK